MPEMKLNNKIIEELHFSNEQLKEMKNKFSFLKNKRNLKIFLHFDIYSLSAYEDKKLTHFNVENNKITDEECMLVLNSLHDNSFSFSYDSIEKSEEISSSINQHELNFIIVKNDINGIQYKEFAEKIYDEKINEINNDNLITEHFELNFIIDEIDGEIIKVKEINDVLNDEMSFKFIENLDMEGDIGEEGFEEYYNCDENSLISIENKDFDLHTLHYNTFLETIYNSYDKENNEILKFFMDLKFSNFFDILKVKLNNSLYYYKLSLGLKEEDEINVENFTTSFSEQFQQMIFQSFNESNNRHNKDKWILQNSNSYDSIICDIPVEHKSQIRIIGKNDNNIGFTGANHSNKVKEHLFMKLDITNKGIVDGFFLSFYKLNDNNIKGKRTNNSTFSSYIFKNEEKENIITIYGDLEKRNKNLKEVCKTF